jgi:serine/threonine protein phosphatase 1
MRRFAISDIHGCVQTFQDLLLSIKLSEEDELYLLGDYIDRGPDSQGVLDTIFDLRDAGFKVTRARV